MGVSQPLAGLGTRLRSLRDEAGISQDELAEKLEVHQTAVSAWERGTAIPTPAALLRLAEFHEVTVDHLLGREPAA